MKKWIVNQRSMILVACFLGYGTWSQAEVLYQDDFDNDGLGVNSSGVGGGAVNNTIYGHTWTDDGDATVSHTGTQYTRRALLYSENAFQSDDGFKLTVNYTTGNIASWAAHSLSFGIISSDTDLSSYTGFNPFGADETVYSLGVNLTTVLGESKQGLCFTDGVEVMTLDQSGDNSQFLTDTSTPVVINIRPNGAWSYSINGVFEASGVIPDFDLSKSYHVVVYGQDDQSYKAIQSVKLETAESYYVATTGNDSNAGTLAQPFASIQHAVGAMAPGDTCYIRGGSYHESVDLSGVTGITLTPYGDEEVILDGRVKIETAWTLEEANSVTLPAGNDTPTANIPGIGNVYVTTLDSSIGDITELYVDEKVMTLARFPNDLVYSDSYWFDPQRATASLPTQTTGVDIPGTYSLADLGVSVTGCMGAFKNWRQITAHSAGSSEFTRAAPIRLDTGSSTYFLEGGVDNAERVLLDSEQEWAYDESTGKLTFWAENSTNPNGLNVYAKNQNYSVTGDASTSDIIIDGVEFFATAFQFYFSDRITIQNCEFNYYSRSEHALGSGDQSPTAYISGSSSDFCEDIIIYNCAFRYTDSTGIFVNYADQLTLDNCLFYKTCHSGRDWYDEYSVRHGTSSVDLNNSKNILFRRNTVSVSRSTQTIDLSRYKGDAEVYPLVAEYNYCTQTCLNGGDASTLYVPEEDVNESLYRFNWFIDNNRRDFRFDGANINEVVTTLGNFYRNVAMSDKTKDHAYRLKGDYHEVYQSLAIGNAPFNVAQGKGGNANTVSRNNAADVFNDIIEQSVYPDYFEVGGPWEAGEAFDRAQYDWDIAGDDANSYSPAFSQHTKSMHALLRDPDNHDFRPRADAIELIDQGVPVACTVDGSQIDVTAGYLGDAPDIGAYEHGDTNYWIPGRQEEQASMSVPKNGGGSVPLDTDLMYLIGLDGVSANIYFGRSPYALSFLTNKSDPENIVTLSDHTTLDKETTYYWRVDTVLFDGSIVTGDVWSFVTEIEELQSSEILPWANNSIFAAAWSQDSNGDLVYSNNGTTYTRRAVAYSTNTYQSDSGFRLTAYYTTGSIEAITAHKFAFGLVSTDTDLSIYSGDNPFMDEANIYSLGVNLIPYSPDAVRGLTFTDGTQRTILDESGDNAEFLANESTQVVLEIRPDGAWTYSINGLTEASGVIAGGFDLSKSYRVAVYGQDDDGGGKSIQHLVLEDLPEGLLADWSMDESSGDAVADASGNAFDGSTFNAARTSGLAGNAVEYNGSDSSLILPPEAFADVADEITVAMWVYGDSTQPRGDTVLSAIDSDGNRVLNIHLPWSNQTVYWDAGNSGNIYDRISSGASATEYKDQWNHWVFTKNAATGSMAIYLNGALWYSGAGNVHSMEGIVFAAIGNSVVGDSSYDGLIDEVQLYNIELSASEVYDLAYSYTTTNGVPKVWLIANGIEPTDAGALADSDGDGLANWEEYQNGNDPTVSDNTPGIRVTEYYLTTGDFTGTSATLTLDQNLADDYFILVRGSHDGNGLSMPNNDYARVTGVPNGDSLYAGNMVGSGNSNLITLERSVADFDWEGVVTVVECTNPNSNDGFKLIDIVSTELTATSGTDTSAAWSEVDQVTLFGGYRGGGATFSGSPADRKEGTSVYTRLYPSGTNTLNWTRDAGGEVLYDTEITTFVIEWGSEWTVQRVNVAGSNGGDGADAAAEYTTAGINSVNRDNTWVWATGTRADSGIGDSSEACLVTLGNGVDQNATENTVAVGSEYTDTYDFDVYTMTHPDLTVDHRFKADGDSGSSDLAVTVDAANTGARFGWVYNGCNGVGTYFPRPRLWSRYTDDSTITLSRGFSGQNFPAWVQGIDFSDLND